MNNSKHLSVEVAAAEASRYTSVLYIDITCIRWGTKSK